MAGRTPCDFAFSALQRICFRSVSRYTALTTPWQAKGRPATTYFLRCASAPLRPMPLRSIRGTIDSLRATLRRLEDNPEPARDARALADLIQILLNRIALLEAEEASTPCDHDFTNRAA